MANLQLFDSVWISLTWQIYNHLVACEFHLQGKFTVLRYTVKRLVENFKSCISNYDKEKEEVLCPKIQHFTSLRFKLFHRFPAFYNFNVMVIWSSCNSCDHVKIIKFYQQYWINKHFLCSSNMVVVHIVHVFSFQRVLSWGT